MAFIDKFKSKWGRMKSAKEVAAPETAQVKAPVVKKKIDAILQPLVTEKTATLASHGKYTFVVARGMNKLQVNAIIKAKYGILPTSVHMQNQRGKHVRFGGIFGKQAAWKKAIVTLPKGKTLDIYEGV